MNFEYLGEIDKPAKAISLVILAECLPALSVLLTDIHSLHIPPIIFESLRLLAYIGASVTFFKWIGATYRKTKERLKKP